MRIAHRHGKPGPAAHRGHRGRGRTGTGGVRRSRASKQRGGGRPSRQPQFLQRRFREGRLLRLRALLGRGAQSLGVPPSRGAAALVRSRCSASEHSGRGGHRLPIHPFLPGRSLPSCQKSPALLAVADGHPGNSRFSNGAADPGCLQYHCRVMKQRTISGV